MPVVIPRGPQPEADEGVREVVTALDRFVADHPGAEAAAYRHGRFSIRVRVVWGGFRKLTRADRRKVFEPYLDAVSDDTASDLAFVVLATPEEHAEGAISEEFDNPVPTLL